MIGSAIRLALLVSCVLTLCQGQGQGQGQDATRVSGGSGSNIVDAVINRIRSRCIFSEDRLFLRRLAKVMSDDGTASYTYRANFNGGIWQVTESMFNATKACNNLYLRKACVNITSDLGIQWTAVRYFELRKPLYSGLAAALSALLTLSGQQMPGTIAEQATKAGSMYNDNTTAASFRAKAELPPVECDDKLDLAFVLDSSGSVSTSDFKLMLNFTANVVGHLNLSSENVRVAVIVYSNTAQVHFDFNGYHNKSEAQRLVMSTPKEHSSTDTAQGLKLTTNTLYNPSRGARNDSKKVAVLITDGRSNSFSRTVQSGAELKDLGTTVFAVGVGNYALYELNAVASSPTCSRVLTLTRFDHIKSLLTEIIKSTCEANVGFKSVTSRNISESGSDTTTETRVPQNNETIEASVSCGILNIFVSAHDPRPSEAVHDSRYISVPGAPAYLTFPSTLATGATIYVTVVGTRLPASVALARQCTDFSWTLAKVTKKSITVNCTENGVPRPCTKKDVIHVGLCQNDNSDFPFDDPCTQANLDKGLMRHPYPYDNTKFLQCDMKGRAYVTQCPGGVVFNAQTRECGFTSPPLGSVQEQNTVRQGRNASGLAPMSPLPRAMNNPCTATALAQNRFYHEYASDKTSFIQCDQWGKAWVRPCAPSTVWSQSAYTCTKKAKQSVASTGCAPPTCTATTTLLLEDPCSPTSYYQCVHGIPRKRSCPGELRFDANINACNW